MVTKKSISAGAFYKAACFASHPGFCFIDAFSISCVSGDAWHINPGWAVARAMGGT